MIDPLSATNTALNVADTARNRLLDLLVIGTVTALIWIWWRAHHEDEPRALVPNERVAEIAPTVPDSVYTYNMPFYGARRHRIAIPHMPSPTRVPMNPSGQPAFDPEDSTAEAPSNSE